MRHPTDETRSACGVWMNPLCFVCDEDEVSLIGCTLCWRSGCARWIAAPVQDEERVPTEVVSDDDDDSAIDSIPSCFQ